MHEVQPNRQLLKTAAVKDLKIIPRKRLGLVTGGLPVLILGWVTGRGAPEQGTQFQLIPRCRKSYYLLSMAPL